MSSEQPQTEQRVVTASREVEAPAEVIFELIADPRGISYLMVTGRRGGSAMAAAAVNAIATEDE